MTPPKTAREIVRQVQENAREVETSDPLWQQVLDLQLAQALKELAEVVTEQEIEIIFLRWWDSSKKPIELIKELKALISTKLGGNDGK